MTIKLGTNTGLYVKTSAIATDPAPQINQKIVLANTVDGAACTMSFGQEIGCGIWNLTVDGVAWVDTPLNHGQGIPWADNFLRTGEVVAWNPNSPTEGGCQRDGVSAVTGMSNCLYQAVSADQKQLFRVQYAANWGAPHQITNTMPAWNDRLVSTNKVVTHVIWGWNGDDHVIQFLRDVHIPAGPMQQQAQEWDAVTISICAKQAVFGTEEFLEPIAGTFSAYPGFPATSNNLLTVASSADATKAITAFHPAGEWGPTGYSQLWTTVGLNDVFIRAREVYAGGSVPPGTRRYNAYMVIGSRAQLRTSVMALAAANITRTTDIVLPDLAA